MTIKLFLSQTDSRPMYLQIMAQIKQKVMVGDWPTGFHLPSIRELAASTGVSVITVKRAYLELEREGVIYTQQGKGSFIADTNKMQTALQYEELDEKIKQAISLGIQMGLTHQELLQRIAKLCDEHKSDNG
ncbi:GntR family transcriptional regulator [Glaciecola sp. 1036]|uniref:GntR family transcriptional regulator n=1 Tax=Alteromonadaceae TaxID=72275 RepID=UPI003D0884CA